MICSRTSEGKVDKMGPDTAVWLSEYKAAITPVHIPCIC